LGVEAMLPVEQTSSETPFNPSNVSKSYQILNVGADFVTFTQHRFLKTLPGGSKPDF
jgi:hypothetical protein